MENNISALLELDDYALIMTLADRIREELSRVSFDEEWAHIPDSGIILVTVEAYDLEMQNGGLCQYFTNAGFQAQALGDIGAKGHADLFEAFCGEHGNRCGVSGGFRLSGDRFLPENAGTLSVCAIPTEV